MDRRWLITACYLAALAVTISIAKLLCTLHAKEDLHWKLRWLLLAPTLSTDASSQPRNLQQGDIRGVLVRALLFFPAIVAFYALVPDIISQRQLSGFLQGYIGIIPLWVLTETVSLTTQLCFLPAGILVLPIHKQPWRSQTLAEFWGQRWNRVFSDWLRQVCFRPLRRRPSLALIMTFAVSGIMHEFLVNVPLWIVFGTNLFGSMCLYFLIQAFGIFVERKYLKRHEIVNRGFMWGMIVGPVPLVLNEGTLRIFHFVR